MKKLNEHKGEEALDLLADLFVPASKLIQDKKVVALLGQKKIPEAVKVAIKGHKAEILEILALMEGVPVAEYNPGFFVLPFRLMEVFSDPDLLDLFYSLGQRAIQTNSGSASEITEAR